MAAAARSARSPPQPPSTPARRIGARLRKRPTPILAFPKQKARPRESSPLPPQRKAKPKARVGPGDWAAWPVKGRERAEAGPARPIPAAPVNAAIVAFARQSFGKQIGNGECWTLADKALKVAGAKAPDVYVWGRALDPT